MNPIFSKNLPQLIAIFALLSFLLLPQGARAQGFYYYTRAIPQKDTNGVAMAGANTTFADGSVFQPAPDTARSSKWTLRIQGDVFILSSLGPGTSTPPTETKELVTTVSGLKPGARYAAKALFWAPDTSPWGLRAGLTYANGQRTNPWFTNLSAGVVKANLLAWETMPALFSDSVRDLYAAPLGIGTANSSGQLKIYVHDLPATDSNLRTWYQGVAVAEVTEDLPHGVDCSAAGKTFNRGVRGIAISDLSMDRGEYWVGIPTSLEVLRGSATRGVATGLAADIFDWRTRNGQPRPPTLQFLRYSRDYQAELFMGVNMRGLIRTNGIGGWEYYDTNISTLTTMAADWVHYVNEIVPAYRQGDSVNDPRDVSILDSLTWSSTYPGDSWTKLLLPSEAAVPQVKYWEIGNEPTVGVSCYSVSNSFTVKTNDYYLRYKAIAQAIKAEDPNAKVGPTLIHAEREDEHLNILAADPSVPLDFVTYHPYERMGQLDDPAQISLHLGSVYSRQKKFLTDLKNIISKNSRNPDATEFAATEVNVSSWDTNDTDKEARIAHALGTVETIFSHARLGLVASLYWIWPAHRWDGTRYPVFKAYEKLRDHMGDTLLSTYAFKDGRLYTTRDSKNGKMAVWAMNFSNDQDTTVTLQLTNLPPVARTTLLRLQAKSGPTTLFSANLSSEMLGGPAINVDWTSSNLTGANLSNYQLSLPAATLSLLVIEPGLDQLTPTLAEQNGQKHLAVSFKRLPHASDVRYKLLRSDDLTTWQVVAEASPGTSESILLTDDAPCTDSPHRFYRVGVVW